MSPSAPSVDHNQFAKPTMEAEMSSGEGPRPMLLAKVIGGSSSNYRIVPL
jgi:hypothetical protein